MRKRAIAGVLGLVLVAGCGGHDDHEEPSAAAPATAPADSASADAGFVREMVPHHEGAVEMAQLALDQAEHPELEQLSRDIISTQRAEIEELEAIAGELGTEAGHPAGDGGHMGQETHAMGDPDELDGARPFDQAFIDMMIPHHEAAIEMSRALLETTENPRLRTLAEDIAGAQQREIDQMRAWRADWYGGG